MSDTWSDIQALKSRQSSMRERLARRKKEREGLVADITGQSQSATPASAPATSTSGAVSSAKKGIPRRVPYASATNRQKSQKM